MYTHCQAEGQIEFSESLLDLLDHMQTLDDVAGPKRLWYPKPMKLLEHFRRSHQDRHVTDGEDEHENDRECESWPSSPIAAFNSQVDDALGLGEAKRRNPEYAPFDSSFLRLIAKIASVSDLAHNRSLMYALKAGVMTALTTLPAFLM
jgi:hypothetical protein